MNVMKTGREVVSLRSSFPLSAGVRSCARAGGVQGNFLAFMRAPRCQRIHGYRPGLGLCVFTQEALEPTRRDSWQ